MDVGSGTGKQKKQAYGSFMLKSNITKKKYVAAP
jgi:hypothetical protein